MLVTEDTFYKIIQDTWASTLGFHVDCPVPAELSTIGVLTVCVRISGSWEGEVQLHCPLPLARLIAAAIYQVNTDKADNDEILDALSELIHIVGGNLKALLPQPVTLSLPSLQDPTNSAYSTPQWPVVCQLTLMSEGQPFVVTLVGEQRADAIEPATVDREICAPTEIP
jgi:chemotaxis protein CheX